jgi:hypothetical protein
VTSARDTLRALIAAEALQPVAAPAAALVEAMRQRHGEAVAAVIFYGSCLRVSDLPANDDPVFDFYLLVDSYRQTYGSGLAALANTVLPPNVFYLELPWQGRRLRAKYAVVAVAPFRRLLSANTFHSYFWARFAQPVRLAYARDDAVRNTLLDSLIDAVVTLVSRAAALTGADATPEALWTRAFQETYRAELRAEGSDRARLIYEADRDRYDRILPPALAAAGSLRADPPATRAWARRRLLGKLLSVLRLAKGVFTFDGGLDYILWKIERHSGVTAAVTPWQRRHPLLAAPGLAWRLYRRGAFR